MTLSALSKSMHWSKAEVSDAEAISALALGTCEKYLFNSTTEEGRKTLRELYSPSNVRRQILANDHFELVIHDEELVGAAAMRSNDHHVYLFFVTGRLHGHGLGRKLMNALTSNLGDAQYITLNSSMYAVEFYKHLGFEATGPLSTAKGVESLPMKLTL